MNPASIFNTRMERTTDKIVVYRTVTNGKKLEIKQEEVKVLKTLRWQKEIVFYSTTQAEATEPTVIFQIKLIDT